MQHTGCSINPPTEQKLQPLSRVLFFPLFFFGLFFSVLLFLLLLFYTLPPGCVILATSALSTCISSLSGYFSCPLAISYWSCCTRLIPLLLSSLLFLFFVPQQAYFSAGTSTKEPFFFFQLTLIRRVLEMCGTYVD